MNRLLVYFGFGLVFLLLQATVIPWLLPSYLKPDLLLILLIYLGLNENFRSGAILAYLLGCLLDVFAGHYLGLNGFVFLAIFFAARVAVRWFNTESSMLLVTMVFWGALAEGGLVMFALGVFAEAGDVWPVVLMYLFPRAISSCMVAEGLLLLLNLLQRRLGPRWNIPGLNRLDDRYGF